MIRLNLYLILEFPTVYNKKKTKVYMETLKLYIELFFY
jgi:hypothetical protein